MATYKLIQDIEAEDHIIGPLTLRQFIFALITAFLLYVNFYVVIQHVPFLLIIFIPPTLLVGFFAVPFGRDQPTEVWALAKIRFWLKPHLRLWNQSGVKELVTITVPKRIEHVYTNNLTQVEVKSRLKALANTIDSRGWAIKNVNIDSYSYNAMPGASSDRLLDLDAIPQQVPDAEPPADYDMFDEQNSPVAQQLNTMITQSTQAHRQTLLNEINREAEVVKARSATGQPADYWFMNVSPSAPVTQVKPAPLAAADPSAEDQALINRIKKQATKAHASYGHMRTLQPLSATAVVSPPADASDPSSGVTNPAAQQATDNRVQSTAPTTVDADILSLANNNDLDVATLARQAKKKKDEGDEVVIPLR